MKKTGKEDGGITLFGRFLNLVEAVGNRLPHPITMFALFALAIVLLSGILSALGVFAVGEVIDSRTLEASEETVTVVSLMNREGLAYMLTHMVSNFTGFAPLGVVLVTMLGVGFAEGSGYLEALLKKAVSVTPEAVVTPMLIFLGVMSNVASDVGYVVLIPLGAVIFMAYGRHPMAGIAAAFAGVSGGFSANLLIGTLDPMLAGISTESAQMVSPGYVVEASANWYFMIVSTFLIVGLGTYVTDRIVEPRLRAHMEKDAAGKPDNAAGRTDSQATGQSDNAIGCTGNHAAGQSDNAIGRTGNHAAGKPDNTAGHSGNHAAGHIGNHPAAQTSNPAMDPRERRALRRANATFFFLVAALVLLAAPGNSFLRNPATKSLLSASPLMDGLIVIIALLFFVPSVVYGRTVGTYQGEKDVCAQLGKNMEAMGGYIALSFAAAQFINYFNYTRLGTILALKGAEFLGNGRIPGPFLMILFILLAAVINLFMGSASAKWTILAPVFVPMFMLLGYSPELTQVAYRIGDSCTNLVTPLMSYFAMIVVFAKKYDRDSGIGTLISTMVPYSVLFLIGWSLLLLLWMSAGLPLGPGAALRI